MHTMFVFFSSVILLYLSTGDKQSNPSVTAPQGRIIGRFRSDVNEFLGIPFAKAPVGHLRLKPPQPVDYKDVYHAQDYKPACVQDLKFLREFNLNKDFKNKISENCLYLNVYVPKTTRKKNLPVMVWLHGGAYSKDSGSSYNGGRLSAQGQVIVVTINYRLGLLGFFPNGGRESTLGLQDQIMALKWVNASISAFGGDPSQVTIFGQSAGGASAFFLSKSPRAKGLFQRVICQSGVATSAWAINSEIDKKMNTLFKIFANSGCIADNLLDCMQDLNEMQIIQLTAAMGATSPQVDNDVIMENYASDTTLVHEGLEFIMGTLPNEGAESVYMICTDKYTTECDMYTGIDLQQLIDIQVEIPKDIVQYKNKFLRIYNNWYPMKTNPGLLNVKAATKLDTDAGYQVPVNTTATRLARAGFRVQLYEFNAVSGHGPLPEVPWSSEGQHMDELQFLFGTVTEGRAGQVAETMIKLWTDFAYGRLNETSWPRFTTEGQDYLYIDQWYYRGHLRTPYFPHEKNNFWRNYLDKGWF